MSIVRALCHDVHEPGAAHRNEDLLGQPNQRMGPTGMFQGIYLASPRGSFPAAPSFLPYGGFPAPPLGRENLSCTWLHSLSVFFLVGILSLSLSPSF